MKTVKITRWILNVILLLCLLNIPRTLLALPEGAIKQLLAGTGTPHDIKFSPDGNTLAVAGRAGIVLYETKDYRPIKFLEGHKNHVAAIAFSPDSKRLASASWDATIKLWNVDMKTEHYTFKGHSEAVNAVVFAPDGEVLASGSADKTIKLWDTSERREIATLEGHKGPVTDLVFSFNGERLVSGSQDGTIKLWNVPGVHVTKTLEEHRNWVSTIALSPDGQTFASGSRDKTLWIGEIPSGEQLAKLSGSQDHHANDVTFSPDGRTLALAYTDHTVRLRSHTNYAENLDTLPGHDGPVIAIAFSPDPTRGILASVSEDETVILWDLTHFGIEIRGGFDIVIGGEQNGNKVSPMLLISGDPSFPEGGLKAGETATLSFYAQNNGDADADQVKVIFSSDAAANNLLSVTRPAVFKIPKNDQTLVKVPIRGDRTLPNGTSKIKIQLHDTEYDVRSQIVDVPIKTVALPVEALPKPGSPRLVLAQVNLNDITPDLPQVSRDRIVELKFNVENQGNSTAEDVTVTVSHNHQGLYMRDGKSIKNLKSIVPGYDRDAAYTYLVTDNFKETEIIFEIKATVGEGSGFTKNKSFLTNRVLQSKPRDNVENSTDTPDRTEDVEAQDIDDIRKNIPFAKESKSNAIAFVVGINKYEDKNFGNLSYAKDDAEYVRKYLVKTLGYKEENILPDPDEDITIVDLQNLLKPKASEFSRAVEVTKNAEVFIYFSGHGAPGGSKSEDSFLLATDSKSESIENYGYSLRQFRQDLADFYKKNKCKRLIVVLDACFSGVSKTGTSLGKTKAPRIPQLNRAKNPLEDTDTILITSSLPNERSHEFPDIKHSLFTFCFLKGLQGKADKDDDKRVTFAELKDYIPGEVASLYRKYNKRQTPQINIYNGDLEDEPIVEFKEGYENP